MALERDLELLDDYLANRMEGAEREAFEQKLDANLELKGELQTQLLLITSLKKARAAELKSMLKNVPITAGPADPTLLTKVAASVVVAGLIGTGVYFFANRDTKINEVASEPAVQTEPTEQEEQKKKPAEPIAEITPTTTETVVDKPATQETAGTVKVDKKAIRKAKREEKRARKDSAAVEAAVTNQRKLEVFDPTREVESTTKPNTVKSAESTVSEINTPAESNIQVITDKTNKKYQFHYQWKDDKLVLFGSFERNLYEILEFFSDDDKRTAFLYYKENYYLLSEENERVHELTPITDANLLKKLKERREK